ncbi:DUF1850 domain-containing protein [Aliihoeflea aestuarii]|uniref:DUF1850 domain-containing protein n=1 Tax=Aliihoeflea aestuarii TaxID=453840 RepID=UPI002093A4DF|nr:DUF1850 domain-containing protein [Aliihoeflea aestuarii]MCO6391044.1 DUF1850 domain-containing protein [Aliihoeflea aestuarii]
MKDARCGLLPALALTVLALPATAGTIEVIGADSRKLASVDAQSWCIAWNHSVAGFEVKDCYSLRGGLMVLERSHQPDFAAGLGHIPGRGVQRSDGAGGYWIDGIDEIVPGNCYRLRVGSARVDHRIVAGDIDISLTELAAGTSVAIRASDPESRGIREC